MIERIRSFVLNHREALRYIFFGGLTTLVSWGTYSVLIIVFPQGEKSISIANALSWICAVLFAFVSNKMWVFESRSWLKDTVIPEFRKFMMTRIGTGCLEIIGVPLLVCLGFDKSLFGVEGLPAKVLVSILVVLLNYIFSKNFIFRAK